MLGILDRKVLRTLHKGLYARFRSPRLLKKSGPRRISAGPLHALRRSHSLPINLVVYKAPYYLAIWEASSQGGLHA